MNDLLNVQADLIDLYTSLVDAKGVILAIQKVEKRIAERIKEMERICTNGS